MAKRHRGAAAIKAKLTRKGVPAKAAAKMAKRAARRSGGSTKT